MSKKIRWSLFLLIIFSGFFLSLKRHQTESAALSSVKDVLSNSQLSFYAILGTGNSAGDTYIRINAGNTAAPSFTTYNISAGDTLGIGMTNLGGILTTYTVKDIGNTALIELNSAVGVSNAYAGLAVIATRSAIHTVSFQPAGSYTAGKFQFLLKATSRTGEDHDDGIPDQQGFDLGQDVGSTQTGPGTAIKAADLTCPLSATKSVGTTVVVSSSSYHLFGCTLGAGVTNAFGVGNTYVIVVGRDLGSGSQLINPSASSNRPVSSIGTADTYTYYVRHLDSSDVVRDITQGKIAVVEAVRITATVDPSITFTIGTSSGTGVGETACGNSAFGSNAANVTAASVPFGSLNLAAFNNLAQYLTCVTNAPSGYVVTVYENLPLTRVGASDTIPNTDCDGACSYTTAAAWSSDTSNSGFGYTVQNLNVGTTIFSYPNYKAFGQGASQAQEIFKNTATPASTERAFICYRLVASTGQVSGNYENEVIFTATATF